MSAATAVHGLGLGWGHPKRDGRPRHLRAVRPDERAASPRPPMRITRRGRLAVTASVGLALALTAALMLGLIGPAGAASADTVVVEPGQTLSQIAATELPDLPLDRALVEIQVANRLSSSQVQAGQELVIPTP